MSNNIQTISNYPKQVPTHTKDIRLFQRPTQIDQDQKLQISNEVEDDPKMSFLQKEINEGKFNRLCKIHLGSSPDKWNDDWKNMDPLTEEDKSNIIEDLNKWREECYMEYQFDLKKYNGELENRYLSSSEPQVQYLFHYQSALLSINSAKDSDELIPIAWRQQPDKFRLVFDQEEKIIMGLEDAQKRSNQKKDMEKLMLSFVYFTELKSLAQQKPKKEKYPTYLERGLAQCAYYAKRSYVKRLLKKEDSPIIGFSCSNNAITHTGFYDANNNQFFKGPKIIFHPPEQYTPVTLEQFFNFQKEQYEYSSALLKLRFGTPDMPIRQVFKLVRKIITKK